MEPDKLSDELKEKLMAAKTPDELSALAEEYGFDLSDEELKGVAGGGGMRPEVISGDTCKAKVVYKYCKEYEVPSSKQTQ